MGLDPAKKFWARVLALSRDSRFGEPLRQSVPHKINTTNVVFHGLLTSDIGAPGCAVIDHRVGAIPRRSRVLPSS